MKLKLILALCLFKYSLIISAQSIIPYDSLKFSVGDKFLVSKSIYKRFGDSGLNVQWDFSDLTKIETSEYKVLSPTFPNSNILLHDVKENIYQHIYEDTLNRNILAYYNVNSSLVQIFSKPLKIVNFPIEFGHLKNDTSIMAMYNASIQDSLYIKYYYSIKVDGYGDLKTPKDIYPNCLRVKTHGKQIVEFNGIASETQFEFYDWYKSGFSYPLLNVSKFISNGNISYSTSYLENFINSDFKIIADFKPVNLLINDYESKIEIQTDWKSYNVKIYDLKGKCIYLGNEASISTNTLINGIYIVKVLNTLTKDEFNGKIFIP